MRTVFDIEANGLYKQADRIWMLCGEDINTGITYDYCDYNSGCKPLKEFKWLLDESEVIIGHFILGYDLPMLKKVFGWEPRKSQRIQDTLVMSQVLNYNRFYNGKHNLETWGEHFGIPKPEHENWMEYSDEMLHRCRTDRTINVKVYKQLSAEFKTLVAKKPPGLATIGQSLRNEQDVLKFCTEASISGWPFDKPAAEIVMADIQKEMNEVEEAIEPLLRLQVKAVDKGPKEPKWVANGKYSVVTARMFDINPEEGLADFPLVMGSFSRIEFTKPGMGQLDAVKELLYSIGWEPDDWNWKRVGQAFIKGEPKLTTTSLLPLGEVGVAIDKYYTLRSRYALVKGWVENCIDGRVFGDCFTIATPTGRARHNGIVNVPGGDEKTLFGKRIRQLFIATPGYKIIGADSSGNQMRAFCHYRKNDEYTEEVVNGDVHTKNMLVLQEVVPATTRKLAKPFLYASNESAV